MTALLPVAAQHPTHQRLLHVVPAQSAPAGRLDAIIVPNGRSAPYLRHAIKAARETGATLLLLCSVHARAASAAREADRAGVRVRAIDIDVRRRDLVPAFRSSELLRENRFERRTDTSFKRNLGLLVADLAGWDKVLFLDDDIALPAPGDLRAAAGLLDTHAAAGLANVGMPDNSVVCHAFRDSGGRQDTFVGGGALAISRPSFGSFFPDIYNEDWFFLLAEDRLRRTALTGTAFQSDYDPYRNAERAYSEELGDTLAEGLYSLLDHGRDLTAATEGHWRDFLAGRKDFIRRTIRQVEAAPALDAALRARMVVALRASLGRSHRITPQFCVAYLAAWRADRELWRAHLAKLRAGTAGRPDLDRVLRALGIAAARGSGVVAARPSGRLVDTGRDQPLDQDEAQLGYGLGLGHAVEGVADDGAAAPVPVAEPAVEPRRSLVVGADGESAPLVTVADEALLGRLDQCPADALVP